MMLSLIIKLMLSFIITIIMVIFVDDFGFA
jgi:hypothetical protein